MNTSVRKIYLSLENNLPTANNHYSVYVVELSKDVLKEHKFMIKNPDYITGKPCLYIGMTGLKVEDRLSKHMNGIKHNVYVLKYGLHLVPELYEKYNPMSFEQALEMEFYLGNKLRELGCACWFA